MKKIILITLLFAYKISAQNTAENEGSYNETPRKYRNQLQQILPQKVDLSIYAPTALNQGTLNTCVGLSTGYYMRTILEARRLGYTNKDKIENIKFSPSYIYNAVKPATDLKCQAGTEIRLALNYMKEKGIATYAQQAYPMLSNINNLAINPDSKILDYVAIFDLIDKKESNVIAAQKALADSTPVVVGLLTTPSIDNLGLPPATKFRFYKMMWFHFLKFLGVQLSEKNDYALWKPAEGKVNRGGHAVCVVGYDNKKYGGAFQIINSRGHWYGDDGYFWIKYADFEDHTKYGYQAFVPAPNEKNKVVLSGDIQFDYGKEPEFIKNVIENKSKNAADSTLNFLAYYLKEPQPTCISFKFKVSLQQKGYVYLIGSSSTALQETQKLFPNDTLVSALISPNMRVDLPEANQKYTAFPPAGTDHFLFLFSETTLNVDEYIAKILIEKGNFQLRVLKVFGNELVPTNQINYKNNKTGFYLKSGHSGKIVPLLISYDQINPKNLTAEDCL
jgi:Domain of unknown function (DUF4384)/Papain family cysteine protease